MCSRWNSLNFWITCTNKLYEFLMTLHFLIFGSSYVCSAWLHRRFLLWNHPRKYAYFLPSFTFFLLLSFAWVRKQKVLHSGRYGIQKLEKNCLFWDFLNEYWSHKEFLRFLGFLGFLGLLEFLRFLGFLGVPGGSWNSWEFWSSWGSWGLWSSSGSWGSWGFWGSCGFLRVLFTSLM